MTAIVLEEELHANTRRTRITYRALVDGDAIALKCYRRPLFGCIHWLRAHWRGMRIRAAGGSVPPVLFSGWVPQMKCFGFGTAFLHGHHTLRQVLLASDEFDYQQKVVASLGQIMAQLHQAGIEQTDGNLTNFLIDANRDIALVDEDDIRVYRGSVPTRRAMANLANVAVRLSDTKLVDTLVSEYRAVRVDHGARSGHLPARESSWSEQEFASSMNRWRNKLHSKREKRNIEPVRKFD